MGILYHIGCQVEEWYVSGFKHNSYYLRNVFKIIFGSEPNLVSPDNRIVKSEFIFRDSDGGLSEKFFNRKMGV